jgi:hypothetical protein
MKKYILLLIIPVMFVSWTWTQPADCRTFNFGATPEMILKGETAVYLNQEDLAHNLKGISFAEFKDGANYVLTYTFHHNLLNGLKIKKMSLTGDNTFINAMEDYKAAHARYSAGDCGKRIVDKTDKTNGLKAFEISFTNKKVFVNIINESGDYFLTENIIKK